MSNWGVGRDCAVDRRGDLVRDAVSFLVPLHVVCVVVVRESRHGELRSLFALPRARQRVFRNTGAVRQPVAVAQVRVPVPDLHRVFAVERGLEEVCQLGFREGLVLVQLLRDSVEVLVFARGHRLGPLQRGRHLGRVLRDELPNHLDRVGLGRVIQRLQNAVKDFLFLGTQSTREMTVVVLRAGRVPIFTHEVCRLVEMQILVGLVAPHHLSRALVGNVLVPHHGHVVRLRLHLDLFLENINHLVVLLLHLVDAGLRLHLHLTVDLIRLGL